MQIHDTYDIIICIPFTYKYYETVSAFANIYHKLVQKIFYINAWYVYLNFNNGTSVKGILFY